MEISKLKSSLIGLITPFVLFASEGHEAHSAGEHGSPLIHHLMDSRLMDFGSIEILGYHQDLYLSKHFLFFWISALIVFVVISAFYKKNQPVQSGFIAGAIEKFVIFIREDVVKPSIPHGYQKVLPYFLTAFVMIFTANYLGMVPGTATSTSNLSITSALALCTFIVTQYMGIKENGFIGYVKSLVPSGVPLFVIPILFPVEIIGLFTKPFALAVRLFANMTAGHAIIYSFLLIGWNMEIEQWNWFVSVGTIPAAVFIMFLELLVCFLQAYVFTLLSAIFIGAAMHPEH
ncbi:MAG: F0F1 ATP synthase subunit A [Candidatus Delongbacteria bacterium]|nr:F0F1 ATP synthase subunit A [Candidatus Delongbacteria bacterium]MBN2836596.1 F0F1 ATP synthase subunit A [Candidatus Delongbacteria bacterium]